MWKIRAIIKQVDKIISTYNNITENDYLGYDISIAEYIILLEGLRVCAQKINDYIIILNETEADEALEKIYTLITKIEIKIEEYNDNYV